MTDGQADTTAAPNKREQAQRVVISYPDELSSWARDQLDTDRFRKYLRRVLDDLTLGHTWEEFVDVGCCGNSLDVPLRIESVDGPGEMGSDTEIEYTTRETEPGEMAGGWQVQSEGGPNATTGKTREER
ncbi:hypothetical protein ELS19_13075 [Halogeometricum borinquense]|uniref:DUF7968 domain-containing protein n=1 Tax=Halogeometricum borinquense TaxID=60847 RepID=A0A482TLH1_9EURY|nr:hypothetical protein [Halogeometricum borinquense]RYJ14793.1 hypothetical protein ELS19_13075 [Halogeometricum borinquense]